ncbi:arginine--tRNA ligase [bacterium F11]|nr:arginine--tRNA ligase [bacterium F11]
MSPSIPNFDLSVPPPKIPGDLAANIPLVLAKKVNLSPRKLAEEILSNFPKTDLVEKMEIAGPGFLNFWMKDSAYRNELNDLLAGKKKRSAVPTKEDKFLVEFVSANPTGPLHVGHGRGAALGDSLVRVFRYLGYDVTAEFYVNDAGGQIRNLGLSMEARLKECKGEKADLPEGGYQGAYLVDLAKEALESGNSYESINPAQMIFSEKDLAGFASKRILKAIQQTLEDFGVHFDHWYFESELHKKDVISKTIESLENQKHAYQQDGAYWFRATDFGDEKDRVLKKTNEAPTYFASDIAYHADKFSRGYTKLVNIWGADHHGYAQRLKGALKAINQNQKALEIILNQMVSIKGGRLSKRAGNMITLKEVVDEVGRDATRFFFSLRSPGSHFEFDLDLAKKQASDNPVYYVQYVHARCCSIFREAEKRKMRTEPLLWASKKTHVPLEEVERAVLLHMMKFDDVVEICARDFSNHHLPIYLMELAGKYHSFYEKCRVLEEDETLRSFRLDLVEAIRKRVEQGLNLLGVGAPERL